MTEKHAPYFIPKAPHPCEGGCGKPVSQNKKMCLDCVIAHVKTGLEAREIPVDEEEIRRAVAKHIS